MSLCVHFFSSALPVALIGVIITHMIRDHYDTVKQNIGKDASLCIVSKHRTPEEILSYYVEGYEITPDSDFMADLKMLSLEIVDFIIDLEKEYGIRIPEKKLAKVKTAKQRT